MGNIGKQSQRQKMSNFVEFVEEIYFYSNEKSSKSLVNQLFLYDSLFPYILAIRTWIFRLKLKRPDFEVIAGYLEKRISVHWQVSYRPAAVILGVVRTPPGTK